MVEEINKAKKWFWKRIKKIKARKLTLDLYYVFITFRFSC